MNASRCVLLWFIIITVKACISPVVTQPTPNYLKNGGCSYIDDPRDCPKLTKESCPVTIVKDKCGVCETCPKREGEICGGPYYMNGVCAMKVKPDKALVPRSLYCIKNAKLIDQQTLMVGVNITGVCKPNACRRNCTKKAKNLTCGSDGLWRRNPCSLNQANCYLKDGEQPIKKANSRLCGPVPTKVIVPKKTQSHVEPVISTEIYESFESLVASAELLQSQNLVEERSNGPLPTSSEHIRN